MNIDCDVLVIGGGISGLTAAWRCVRHGLQVEVVEAAARTGGVIATEARDGVLYERGPNSVLDNHPEIGELLREVGVADARIDASPLAAKRYVVCGGALTPLPTSPPAFLQTRLFSWRSKLALLREPFVSRAPAHREESVTEFAVRRLGREFLDFAVEPFVAGIYAGNPDELSVRAAFPKLYALEQRYGSLLKGQVLAARERRGKRKARSFSFRNGMQTLPDALARALPRIRTAARATHIGRADDGRLRVAVEHADGGFEVTARAVVLAVPAHAAATLVCSFAPDAACALQDIPYPPVASVAFVYPRADVAHPLDGFGFLAPRVESRRILGTLFSSSMFEGRADGDTALLTTFVGGRRNPEIALLHESSIEEIVREELLALLGAVGTPLVSFVTRWREAIPQYTLGHLARVECAAKAERALPGLFLCGSYRGGVSVGDCIKSAGEIAERARAHVSSTR